MKNDPADLSGERRKLKWKFSGGPLLTQADFGNPLVSASYSLCVYDDNVLIVQTDIAPSSTLWRAVTDRGYRYKDRDGTSAGVTGAKLLGGAAGFSKLFVKGKGVNLALPAAVSGTQFLNNTSGVTAQLHESNGDCYESAFTTIQTIKNDGRQFKAKE